MSGMGRRYVGSVAEPLVSICIPSHNYARYMSEALDAALDQSYRHVEVVVVDDGSVDDSPTVLASYADRVTIELQERLGQGAACNRAFALSSGDIVMFHDADDVLEHDAVERIVAAFTDARVSLVLGRLRDVDAQGRELPGTRPPAGCPMWGGDLRRLVLERGSFFWPETTGQSFRRTALDDIMPIPPAMVPDIYLSNLAALVGSVSVIERPVGRYRVHGTNASLVPTQRGQAWLELKLGERRRIHRAVRDYAITKGLDVGSDHPADEPGRPHDYIAAGLEVAYRRFAGKPGAARWAVEGIRSIARHPQFSIAARARHVGWFAAAAVAPPAVARRLVESRYPYVRLPT